MNWFGFALLSGLLFALSKVVARFFLRQQGDALAFTAVHDFIAGAVLLPFIFINSHFPSHSITWLYFFGGMIAFFVTDYFLFKALKTIDVSWYQILTQIRHILILLTGVVFLSEIFTANKLIAIALIIGGVIIALYQKKRFSWSSGATAALISTVAAVIGFTFSKFVLMDFSAAAYASIDFLAVGMFSFVLTGFKFRRIVEEIKINKFGLILAGALFGVFELFLFMALKYGEASKVIPVSQSSLIFTVLLGIVFLKEREKIGQRLLGMLIVAAGIVLIYFK